MEHIQVILNGVIIYEFKCKSTSRADDEFYGTLQCIREKLRHGEHYIVNWYSNGELFMYCECGW